MDTPSSCEKTFFVCSVSILQVLDLNVSETKWTNKLLLKSIGNIAVALALTMVPSMQSRRFWATSSTYMGTYSIIYYIVIMIYIYINITLYHNTQTSVCCGRVFFNLCKNSSDNRDFWGFNFQVLGVLAWEKRMLKCAAVIWDIMILATQGIFCMAGFYGCSCQCQWFLDAHERKQRALPLC